MVLNLLKSIIVIVIMMMLFSCENSITKIQEITREDTLPIVSATNIEYERTDSGFRQIVLTSPLMNRFGGEDPYVEFPEGFKVTFYDTAGIPNSIIEANHGTSYEKRKLMHARNNVVVKNFDTEEQLDTENLVWDQIKKQIYTSTFVKITTPDKVIYGDSLQAHESFKSREIYNVRGVIEFEDNEEE